MAAVGKKLERTLRRGRLLASVREGLTIGQAAQREGIHRVTAGAMIRKALEELAAQNMTLAEYVRDLEVARLDELHSQLWQIVHDDPENLMAYDRLLKISERRSKLLGLDRPTKVQVTAEVAHTHELVDNDERARLERTWRRVDADSTAELVAGDG